MVILNYIKKGAQALITVTVFPIYVVVRVLTLAIARSIEQIKNENQIKKENL
jgi:hypothetical protein